MTDFPQPVSGTVVPRFGDVATFMRLPLFRDPAEVEIGMVGVPWDGGTTNRPGARHGPRQMRDLSTMMRRIHHVTGISPFELARCGDLGDAPVNPASLDDSLERIEKHFAKIHAAGTVPLSAGGDHLITLPIMRQALIYAWILVFILALPELSASVVLKGIHTQTLATALLDIWNGNGGLAQACAFGMTLFFTVSALLLLATMIAKRFSRASGIQLHA